MILIAKYMPVKLWRCRAPVAFDSVCEKLEGTITMHFPQSHLRYYHLLINSFPTSTYERIAKIRKMSISPSRPSVHLDHVHFNQHIPNKPQLRSRLPPPMHLSRFLGAWHPHSAGDRGGQLQVLVRFIPGADGICCFSRSVRHLGWTKIVLLTG